MGKHVKEKEKMKEIRKAAEKEGINTDPSFQFLYVSEVTFPTEEAAKFAIDHIYTMLENYGALTLEEYAAYIYSDEIEVPHQIWETNKLGWKTEDFAGITLSIVGGRIVGLPPLRDLP